MNSGVYAITHVATGRVYIGSAVNIKNRWSEHRSRLKNGTHHSRKMQNAWNKHGSDAFSFSTLLLCETKDLLLYEQRALDAYKAATEGFNIRFIAESNLGVKRTEETKKKISDALKKLPPRDPEIGRRHSALMKGRKQPESQRIASALGRTGLKASDETKDKLRAHALNRSPLHTQKLLAAAKLHPGPSKDAAQKSIEARRGKSLSAETKAKMSATTKGVPKSPETRARMVVAQQRRAAERRASQSEKKETSWQDF